jgi:hypothetical protein
MTRFPARPLQSRLTNSRVDVKLATITMKTNPSFGYFFAWYLYAGAPARVESPRQPNAD